MNEKIKKKASKDIFIVGITSATVLLSGSAFALEKTNTSDSNQFFNNHTSLADSTVRSKEVLAQAKPGDNQPPAPSNSPTDSRPPSGNPVSPPPPPDAKPRGSSPPPTGTSPVDNPPREASVPGPEPGTWLCINNPNPKCRG